MTTQEIVNGHKFHNEAIGRLVAEYVENETVDPDAYTREEIAEFLIEFAKYRVRWVKSNAKAGVRTKRGRDAEKNARNSYARFGGKNPRANLTDRERMEYGHAVTFLSMLGYDV